MKKINDLCEIKKCKNNGDLIYYGHLICEAHWGMHCDKKIDLKQAFFIVPKNEQKPTHTHTHVLPTHTHVYVKRGGDKHLKTQIID